MALPPTRGSHPVLIPADGFLWPGWLILSLSYIKEQDRHGFYTVLTLRKSQPAKISKIIIGGYPYKRKSYNSDPNFNPVFRE